MLDQAQAKVAEHRDLMFGVALYHECLQVLYEGQELILKTHHDELLAVIRIGEETLQEALGLLERAAKDSKLAARVLELPLDRLEGHEQVDALRDRAHRLVKVYARVFPARYRDQTLSEDEMLCLLDAATLAPLE